MLVSFTVENWRSIKSAVTLSMVASREHANSEQLTQTASMYGTTKILPLAAIYGPNASGKSNLIDALDFLTYLIIDGVPTGRPIPVEPYRLSSDTLNSPTRFDIRLLLDERIYRYRLSVDRKQVVEESLWLERTRREDPLFTRVGKDYDFHGTFGTEPDRLRFVAEGTRDNQTFLHNAVSQNVPGLLPVHDWFAKRLNIVGIGSTYSGYTRMLLRDDFTEFINRMLKRYGTGVRGVRLQSIPREAVAVPDEVLDEAIAELPTEGFHQMQIRRAVPGAQDLYVITSETGQIDFKRVILVHEDELGQEVPFTLSQESEGTRRLISLMPAIFDLASRDGADGKVYVIDELDRSFHTALTSDIVRLFLSARENGGNSQLIFSTHDLLLMEDGALRRDEQWVCENVPTRGTTLASIGSHAGVRKDTDLLKNYIHGAFGGYPIIDDEGR